MNIIKTLLREGLLSEQVFYHGSKRSELSWDNRNESSDYNMLGFGIYLTDNKDEAKYYAVNSSGQGYLHTYTNNNANVLDWFGKVPEWLVKNVQKDTNLYDLYLREVEFDESQLKLDDGCSIEWDELEDDLPEWAIEDNIKPGWFIMKTCNYNTDILISELSRDQAVKYIEQFPHTNMDTIKVDSYEFYGTSKLNYEMSKDQVFNSVAHLYLYLFTKLKSTKATTNYLVKCGLDGIIAKQDTTETYRYSGDKPTVMVIYNPSKFKNEKVTPITVDKERPFY